MTINFISNPFSEDAEYYHKMVVESVDDIDPGEPEEPEVAVEDSIQAVDAYLALLQGELADLQKNTNSPSLDSLYQLPPLRTLEPLDKDASIEQRLSHAFSQLVQTYGSEWLFGGKSEDGSYHQNVIIDIGIQFLLNEGEEFLYLLGEWLLGLLPIEANDVLARDEHGTIALASNELQALFEELILDYLLHIGKAGDSLLVNRAREFVSVLIEFMMERIGLPILDKKPKGFSPFLQELLLEGLDSVADYLEDYQWAMEKLEKQFSNFSQFPLDVREVLLLSQMNIRVWERFNTVLIPNVHIDAAIRRREEAVFQPAIDFGIDLLREKTVPRFMAAVSMLEAGLPKRLRAITNSLLSPEFLGLIMELVFSEIGKDNGGKTALIPPYDMRYVANPGFEKDLGKIVHRVLESLMDLAALEGVAGGMLSLGKPVLGMLEGAIGGAVFETVDSLLAKDNLHEIVQKIHEVLQRSEKTDGSLGLLGAYDSDPKAIEKLYGRVKKMSKGKVHEMLVTLVKERMPFGTNWILGTDACKEFNQAISDRFLDFLQYNSMVRTLAYQYLLPVISAKVIEKLKTVS